MKISNCCGDTGTRRWYHTDTQFIDHGICGECGEMCEYVEEDPEPGSIMSDTKDLKRLLDNHKRLTNLDDRGGTGHGDISYSDADPGL